MSTTTDPITVTNIRPLTRDDHDPGEQWPAFVREERIAARGGERHVSRVRAAEWAVARHFFFDPGAGDTEEQITLTAEEVRRARTIAALEVHGIGGPRGYRGGATVRMPWAQSLGKGRHNASDGDAWDVAIGQVFGGEFSPTPGDVAEAADKALSSDDIEWAVAYASDRAVASSLPEEAHAWTAAREIAMIWREWLLAEPEATFSMMVVESRVAPLVEAARAWPPRDDAPPTIEVVSRRQVGGIEVAS